MTSDQLAAWRSDMNFSQRAAADALGLSLAGYQQLERGSNWTTGKPVEIDRRTALACAAIRSGLSPEGK